LTRENTRFRRRPTPALFDSGLAALLAAALGAAIILWRAAPPAPPVADALGYVSHALALATHGVFGFYGGPDQTPAPSGWSAPLYPALLALLMEVAPSFRDAAACYVVAGPEAARCAEGRGALNAVFVLSGPAVALFGVSVWRTVRRVTDRPAVAWAAMAVALLCPWTAESAGSFLTEQLLLPLCGLFFLALTELALTRRLRWAIALGLVLGLTAATRPSVTLLFWLMIAVGLVALARAADRRRTAAALGLFAAAYAAVCLPWMLRNADALGALALSGGGYAGAVLSHRLGYNEMTPLQGLAAFIYWLPDFGDNLATDLFGAETVAPLKWDGPASLYRYGAGPLFQETLAAAGDAERHAGYLIRDRVLVEPLTHILTSAPLAWRGMMMGYWGLIGWICAAAFLIAAPTRLRRRGLLLLLPALAVIAIHAAISVSIPRYNLIMIPALSLATGWALVGAVDEARGRLRMRRPGRRPGRRT